MVSYDYVGFGVNTATKAATKDAERRMVYDNNFLRQCGIAPLPYLAFWVDVSENSYRMIVGINPCKKRPSLRVFVREQEAAEGQKPGWVLSQEIKTSRRKVVTT